MIHRRRSTALALVVLFGLPFTPRAQDVKVPTLEEILQRLEANLNVYDKTVPSFLCDEHVVSQMAPTRGNLDTVTDSVFRLKRTAGSDHTTTLLESRDIKTVDGKPAASQNMDGPTMLEGAFEGGLAVVSTNQTVCTNYTLQRINRHRADEPYSVRFATVITPANAAQCLLEEDSKGRVTIDPVSMQITHLELTTPHHVLMRESSSEPRVVGKRVITVDYAPVLFGGQTFWMPSVITLHATSDSGTFHATEWSYRATYRNYHKLEVTSHIVP